MVAMKKYRKNAALKELEKIATEALAKEMTGVISSSLAVIGLVENVQAYEKASLESERYRAFSPRLPLLKLPSFQE